MGIKAVIFDLIKTLGEVERPITDDDATSLLREEGYEVYPQAWRHAFGFVVFVDYPREGYGTHEALIRQVFRRLGVDVDRATIGKLSDLFRGSPFVLYGGSGEAVRRVKDAGLKAAIATSTPKPLFIRGVGPIAGLLDFICTGYEAGCEKSNPRMYLRVLDELGVQPGEAVVIGDDPILDVSNPHRLGMRTIQIVRGGTPSEHADETAGDALEAVDKALAWI